MCGDNVIDLVVFVGSWFARRSTNTMHRDLHRERREILNSTL